MEVESARFLFQFGAVVGPIALVVAWWMAELKPNGKAWVRTTLALAVMATVTATTAIVVQMGTRFNDNAWYGFASKELVETIVVELEAGRKEKVLEELKRLRDEFAPTYENRARYDELVIEFRDRMRRMEP